MGWYDVNPDRALNAETRGLWMSWLGRSSIETREVVHSALVAGGYDPLEARLIVEALEWNAEKEYRLRD